MRPSILSFVTEPYRAIAEIASLSVAYPILKKIGHRGNGIVVTVPGFTADDGSMLALRRYLTELGYECFGWGQGYNTHIDQYMIYRFSEYIDELHSEVGEQIHLIGHSLGGVFAREVAKLSTDAVASVITLGAPFNDPENSACWLAKYMYYVLNKKPQKKEIVEHLLESMRHPPECKTTCIYSKIDGIVHWSSCVQSDYHAHVDNIHLSISHAGMAHHPVVLYKISKILKNTK